MVYIVIGLVLAYLFSKFKGKLLKQKVDTQRNLIKDQEEILDFHLGCILSLYTGVSLSPRGTSGIHRILCYLHGEELYDYQLSKKAEEALPFINLQYPEFQTLQWDKSEDPAYWAEWLDDKISQFGAKLPLRPIPIDQLKPTTNKEAWSQAKIEEKSKIETI